MQLEAIIIMHSTLCVVHIQMGRFFGGTKILPQPLGVDCEGTAAGDLNDGRKRGTARAPSFVPVEKLATI